MFSVYSVGKHTGVITASCLLEYYEYCIIICHTSPNYLLFGIGTVKVLHHPWQSCKDDVILEQSLSNEC